jgi:hypothetical protein
MPTSNDIFECCELSLLSLASKEVMCVTFQLWFPSVSPLLPCPVHLLKENKVKTFVTRQSDAASSFVLDGPALPVGREDSQRLDFLSTSCSILHLSPLTFSNSRCKASCNDGKSRTRLLAEISTEQSLIEASADICVIMMSSGTVKISSPCFNSLLANTPLPSRRFARNSIPSN